MTIIYTRADSVLVGWIEDERAVGLYTAAYTIMLGLQILPWMIGTALVPVFARTHVTERDVFESAWHQGIRAVLVIAFPLSLLVSLLATPIMKQVFGPEFARGGAALAIVIWAGPLAGFNTIIAGVLRGARREAWLTSTAALGVLLNVGLNLWAIPVYGIAGAAATTVGTEILIALTLAALAIRNRVVPVPRGPYLGLALALAALAGVALGTRGLPLILTIPASLAVYAAVAILARVVSRCAGTPIGTSSGSTPNARSQTPEEPTASTPTVWRRASPPRRPWSSCCGPAARTRCRGVRSRSCAPPAGGSSSSCTSRRRPSPGEPG